MAEKLTALPKPTGIFQIGRTHLNFIDENRVDPSPLAEGKERDVPIIIWYPIDDSGASNPLKLIKRRDLDSLKKFVLYQIIPDEFCDVLTNSYEDVRITDKIRKLPVLIFSHGLTATMDSNTIFMEHMASHGYIVVSVGHPYDGVASYPDGRSIPIDVKKYNEFLKRSRSEEEDKKSKEYLAQIQREDISVEEMKKLTKKDLLGSELDDQIEVWIDDVLFIKNILIRMNGGKIESQFKGKMDLEKGIGVFGHSYGGATATLSCCLDDRLKYAVNIDGSMYGGLKERFNFNQPSMFMYNGKSMGMNKYFYTINKDDSYSVSIKDSLHFDFADFSYIMKTWKKELPEVLGKINGNLMVRITNDYVLSFFDKYIKDSDALLLERNPYNEVIFKKRIKE